MTLTASGVKRVNNVRKRKINIGQWKDVKRKRLRDAGLQHKSRKGKLIPAKQPPTQVSGIMLYGVCIEGCINKALCNCLVGQAYNILVSESPRANINLPLPPPTKYTIIFSLG